MTIDKITSWLDKTLKVSAFDDVSNNGVQIARIGDEVKSVAFAVDASVRAVEAAAAAGAELLVVHHGISWGGGIKRLDGGVYGVVKTAMDTNVAVYACHLPLDAHPTLGHNAQLAKMLKLKGVKPAFNYHGNVIGCMGTLDGLKIGVCSGGAGEFAEEAQKLGCDVFITGEASWGDRIAAENCGINLVTLGHYETEVWGLTAVAEAMKKALAVKVIDLTDELWPSEED